MSEQRRSAGPFTADFCFILAGLEEVNTHGDARQSWEQAIKWTGYVLSAMCKLGLRRTLAAIWGFERSGVHGCFCLVRYSSHEIKAFSQKPFHPNLCSAWPRLL